MNGSARPARRMGPPGSENWHAMLDGAEAILREEGHGALTSRRVAEQVGVKQRLIYYYFATMDDLIVETFHRLAERELARLTAARAAAMPLRALWDICIHTTDARLVSEFMALANRIDALRSEVVAFVTASREIQLAALAEAVTRSGAAIGAPPAALALLASSLALALTREAAIGVTLGHAEAAELVEGLLAALERG